MTGYLLSLLLALPALLVAGDHPFGEAGTPKRAEAESACTEKIKHAHVYAKAWGLMNGVKITERLPTAVLCRSPDEIAKLTERPATENGGVVRSRADLMAWRIYLSRASPHDVYHECHHVMYQSDNEANAEAFAAWCLRMDEQLERLKHGGRLAPGTKEKR
jgi:hypothetical protein